MKNIVLRAAYILLLFTVAPTFGFAQTSETIEQFDVTVEINSDGSLDVIEHILYDFGANERHGIFREIPKSYLYGEGDNVERYKLILSNFSVSSPAAPESFVREDSSGEYVLRIGDPNETISGEHLYTISYTAENAINFYENFDEVYWNATGSGWDVPIENASLRIILPQAIERADARYSCYAGGEGATGTCMSAELIAARGRDMSVVSSVRFHAENLSAGEGLTGALGFPKGIVPEIEREAADESNTLSSAALFAAGIVSALTALAAVISMIVLWVRRGRDPKGRGTIIVQYDAPEGLSPVETGFIIDEKVNDRDITAEIVSLAEKGYLHILAIPDKILFFKRPSDYYLLKTKQPDEALSEHERLILEFLFSSRYTQSANEREEFALKVRGNKDIKGDRSVIERRLEEAREITPIQELEGSFHTDVKEVKKTLGRTMFEDGYFSSNPSEVKKRYGWFAGIGFLVLLASIIASSATQSLAAVFFIPTGFIILIAGAFFAGSMVRRSEQGVHAKEHALGLKEYLSVAEKDRLEFHFDPRNNPKLFEKLLPYAIALEVNKEWAKGLEDMHIEPDWYTDASMGVFTVGHLSGSLSGFSTAAASGYASPSSSGSGGGGFSGGGAGGGGGGSW